MAGIKERTILGNDFNPLCQTKRFRSQSPYFSYFADSAQLLHFFVSRLIDKGHGTLAFSGCGRAEDVITRDVFSGSVSVS